jgi:type II secretory pathway component PulL
MEASISSGWDEFDLKELVKVSMENVIVDWIGHPEYKRSLEVVLAKSNEAGVKARQLKIGSKQVWQEMIEKDSYLVRYQDNQNIVHFTVKKWGELHGCDPCNLEKRLGIFSLVFVIHARTKG